MFPGVWHRDQREFSFSRDLVRIDWDFSRSTLRNSISVSRSRVSNKILDLVSKHEDNKMKISISSRQVRASNIILDLVSKNCTFFHISHDILKSSYMMLNNIFSETVEGTQTKESES